MRELARWLAVFALVLGTAPRSPSRPVRRGSPARWSTRPERRLRAPPSPSPARSANLQEGPRGRAERDFRLLLLDATKSYNFHVEAPGYAPFDHMIKVGIGTMDNEFTFSLQSNSEAAAAQQQAILQQPGYKELDEGLALLRSGQMDAARAKLNEAWRRFRSSRGLGRVGRHRLPRRQPRRGPQARDVVLEHDAENMKCLAIAANSSKELGDLEAHHAYMVRYQALNPDDPATLFNQAAEFLNALDDEHARPLLERCLAVDRPSRSACSSTPWCCCAAATSRAPRPTSSAISRWPRRSRRAAASETVKYL